MQKAHIAALAETVDIAASSDITEWAERDSKSDGYPFKQNTVPCGNEQSSSAPRLFLEHSKALLAGEERIEDMGHIAAAIAHSFSNVLQIVMGNAELCLSSMPPASPAQVRMESIINAGRQAMEIIERIHACTGSTSLWLQQADISDFIREVTRIYEADLPGRITMRYNLCPGLPQVLMDVHQFREAVLQLLSNARDAIKEQGVISVQTGLERVDERFLAESFLGRHMREGFYAALRIDDTGCGMDSATQMKAFLPFYSTKGMGRGLGLPAVLGIIRKHRGAVRLESRPGVGTSLVIILPPE